jgi:PmbA protein
MDQPDPTSHVELASRVLSRARRAGADVAEVSVQASSRLGARVRLGELELLEEAGQRALCLRVIRDRRVGVATTSDPSETGLERCVADALMLAELSEPDEQAGPADPELLCRDPDTDLDLFDPSVDALGAQDAIARAQQAERAALGLDPRLSLSEGATFERATSTTTLVLSTGFAGTVRGTRASLVVSPAVEDTDGRRRLGSYFTAHRHLDELQDGSEVGREAARRTLEKLGARKLPTCEAAVVFEPETSRSLLRTFAGCVVGGAVWRKSSYLADREGTEVASPLVTIIDDPRMPQGLGSRPFDGEGLPTRQNVVVERGVLRTVLLDCYSARKLGRKSTGSAGRSSGTLSAVTSNFVLQPGPGSGEEIVASTVRGLYVTELMGFGFNPVTGDYSQGAAGLWIEDGRVAFPVSEVTISSNLDAMLRSIDAIGNDLCLKSAVAAPTVRVPSMTIGGV